jgi:predicted peroxiredoxin
MSNNETYYYTLTAFNDPDQVAVPLVLANAALAMGSEAIVWTTLEGVNLGKKGSVDDMISPSFGSVKELIDQFIEAGGQIGVCPACANTHGLSEDNLVENGIWMGAAAVTEAIQNRHSLSF